MSKRRQTASDPKTHISPNDGGAPRHLPPEGYVARHDSSFVDVVIGYLILHQGEWVRLTRVFNSDPWACRDAVMVGRRIGLVILGDRQRGYRLVGFQRRPYVHLSRAHFTPAELLTAQERGEVATAVGNLTRGPDVASHDIGTDTLTDIGIDRRRLHHARQELRPHDERSRR